MEITIHDAGNPDLHNPPLRHGTFLEGATLEHEHDVVLSKLRGKDVACRVKCPRFNLEFDAIIPNTTHRRTTRISLLTEILLSDDLLNFVKDHPSGLRMFVRLNL